MIWDISDACNENKMNTGPDFSDSAIPDDKSLILDRMLFFDLSLDAHSRIYIQSRNAFLMILQSIFWGDYYPMRVWQYGLPCPKHNLCKTCKKTLCYDLKTAWETSFVWKVSILFVVPTFCWYRVRQVKWTSQYSSDIFLKVHPIGLIFF